MFGGLCNVLTALDLPRPSSLQLGIEISGKTMGAWGLMGMSQPRVRKTDEGLWKSQALDPPFERLFCED
jgi:hypothetical protein